MNEERDILVVSGIGVGSTNKSAFDSALADAGISDFNIITLSSVVPPNSKIKVINKLSKSLYPDRLYGSRMYVVMAEKTVKRSDSWIAVSGIGWMQEEDGRGVFVEHSGCSKDEVENDIRTSLIEMGIRRGDKYEFSKFNSSVKVGVATMGDEYVCSLVAALVGISNWKEGVFSD